MPWLSRRRMERSGCWTLISRGAKPPAYPTSTFPAARVTLAAPTRLPSPPEYAGPTAVPARRTTDCEAPRTHHPKRGTMSHEHDQPAHQTPSDDPEKAFEVQLHALGRQTKSMTGKVTKIDTNLYRVEGTGAAITRFDLQGSQSWAGQGNKQ